MNRCCLSMLVAMGVAVVSIPAAAQRAAPAASAPASAASAPKAGPERPTPIDLRDSATMPGDLRPENRVTPQIVVPLGKTRSPAGEAPTAVRSATAASGAIDDAAVRCAAEPVRTDRERCRAAESGSARGR